MTKKTMTQKVLAAISEALHQECPDRAAPESALISAISIKVANVICEDYTRKILESELELKKQLLESMKALTGKD